MTESRRDTPSREEYPDKFTIREVVEFLRPNVGAEVFQDIYTGIYFPPDHSDIRVQALHEQMLAAMETCDGNVTAP